MKRAVKCQLLRVARGIVASVGRGHQQDWPRGTDLLPSCGRRRGRLRIEDMMTASMIVGDSGAHSQAKGAQPGAERKKEGVYSLEIEQR